MSAAYIFIVSLVESDGIHGRRRTLDLVDLDDEKKVMMNTRKGRELEIVCRS